MKILHKRYIIIFSCVILFYCCNRINRTSKSNYSDKKDSLNIEFLDTDVIGRQIYPKIKDTTKLNSLIKNKILLIFESDRWYYVFFNRKHDLNLLSTTYWEQLVTNYLKPDFEKRFRKVDYSEGPFLTGLYNSKDSIIVFPHKLTRKYLENKKELDVCFFSTTDSSFKLEGRISVGRDLEYIIKKIQMPCSIDVFKFQGNFKIVLMEATSLIDNAWYSYANSDYYSNYSVAVILSFIDNKLENIRYLNVEYIDYIFLKKNVTTNDICYK